MNQLTLLEIDCDWNDEKCREGLGSLPSDVQARALRYRCLKSRRNLISTQTQLRRILKSLGIPQESLRVCPNGRPYVENSNLEFNLSHSETRAVLALARHSALHRALGVDIEWMPRSVQREALAERFFTAEEYEYTCLGELNFFRIWTRKEAILKSNGVGLRVALDSFQVLEDEVTQEVTGRTLSLGTSLREEGYIVSWAVPADWSPYSVRWVNDQQRDWLADIAEGIEH